MSFSSELREELAKQNATARHCQLAELATLIHFIGQYGMLENGQYTIGFQTDNESIARKGFTLLKKTYNIETNIDESMGIDEKVLHKFFDESAIVDPMCIKSSCCKRVFLRGAFLCIGSMSDPMKSYHLEFVCGSSEGAEQIVDVLQSFQIEAKIIQRKKYFVVYLKEGEAIADLLKIMEARVSLMEFENSRIIREVRNKINRNVNCETANINKTVCASTKQVEDINKIIQYQGLQSLPDNLREIAQLRLEYPDAPLKELGEYADPPVGKSGVNHRLRKLTEIADKI